MKGRLAVALSVLVLSSCQILQPAPSSRATVRPASTPVQGLLFDGVFDNHEQVWQARASAGDGVPPHVVLSIESTAQPDWSIWHVHLDAATPLDAVWAMQRSGSGESMTWLPHRAADASALSGTAPFDARQWSPLEACLLRQSPAPAGLRASGELTRCAALGPGLGAAVALMPVALEREGEWLHVRFYADQARGPEARTDLRRVQAFTGWAAINGAGPTAPPNSDWHMNRTMRLGNEGGRAPLVWRDGKPSGYSLVLERVTYRDGNEPVLKLSVIEDAGGQGIAYAWANPEATRIGINIGWVQVGLQRESPAAPAGKRP